MSLQYSLCPMCWLSTDVESGSDDSLNRTGKALTAITHLHHTQRHAETLLGT